MTLNITVIGEYGLSINRGLSDRDVQSQKFDDQTEPNHGEQAEHRTACSPNFQHFE